MPTSHRLSSGEELSVAELVLRVLEAAGVTNGDLREQLVSKAEKLIEARAVQLAIEALPLPAQERIAALPGEAQPGALRREIDDAVLQTAFGQATAEVIPECIRAAAEVTDEAGAEKIEQLLSKALSTLP